MLTGPVEKLRRRLAATAKLGHTMPLLHLANSSSGQFFFHWFPLVVLETSARLHLQADADTDELQEGGVLVPILSYPIVSYTILYYTTLSVPELEEVARLLVLRRHLSSGWASNHFPKTRNNDARCGHHQGLTTISNNLDFNNSLETKIPREMGIGESLMLSNCLRRHLWLRTNGVNADATAAKVTIFDRLGKKVRPGTFEYNSRSKGVPKKSLCQTTQRNLQGPHEC